MKHSRVVQAIAVASLLALLPGLAACAISPSLANVNTIAPAATTIAPTVPAAVLTSGQIQPPDQVPATIPVEDLIAQVEAGLPKDAFEGIRAVPLMVAEGAQPLWAVVSTGRRSFEIEPLPSHFLAIYTLAGDSWQELARMDLDADGSGSGPDFMTDTDCQQVYIEPSRVWLMVAGGQGAHSGSFQLISFDGETLRLEASLLSPSPGMGSVRDMDGDGKLEVVLDQSDPYVFCYACGARDVHYKVLRWDSAQGKLTPVDLQPLTGQPEQVSKPANRAVELAQAGLWKDAYALIQEARAAAGDTPDNTVLNWNYTLIKLHTEALQSTLTIEYPLIQQVFYGDYEAAVDIMRQYQPEEIFAAESPLTSSQMVQPFIDSLSQHLVESATNALQAEPGLAAAHFIRGWGEYLADPTNPQIRADVAQAAQLAPQDALYTASAALLQ